MGNQTDIPQEAPQENNSNNVLRDFAIEGWKGNGLKPFDNVLTPNMEAAHNLPGMSISGDLRGAKLDSPPIPINSINRSEVRNDKLVNVEDSFQEESFIPQVQGMYLRTTLTEAAEARSIGMPAHEYKEHLPSLEITGDQSSARLTLDQINSRESVSQSEPDNIPIGESRIVADEDLAPFPTLHIGENTQTSLAADRQDFPSLPGSNSVLTGQTDSLLVTLSDLNSLADAPNSKSSASQKSLSTDLTDVTASAPANTSNTELTSDSDSYSSNNSTPNNSTETVAYKAPATQNLLPQDQSSIATNPSALADTSNTRLASRTDSFTPNGSTPTNPTETVAYKAPPTLPQEQSGIANNSPTLSDTPNTRLASRTDSFTPNGSTPTNPTETVAYKAPPTLPQEQSGIANNSPTLSDTSNTRLASRTDSFTPNGSTPTNPTETVAYKAPPTLPQEQSGIANNSPTLSDTPNTRLASRTDSFTPNGSTPTNPTETVAYKAPPTLPQEQSGIANNSPTLSDIPNTRLASRTDSYSPNGSRPNPTEALAYKAPPTQNLLPQDQSNTPANPTTLADTSNTRLAPPTDSYSPNGSRPNPTEALAYKAPSTQNLLPQDQSSTPANPTTLADISNTRLASRTDSYSPSNSGNANTLADNPSSKNTSASVGQDQSAASRQTVVSNNSDSNATIGDRGVAKTQPTTQNVASINDLTRSSIASTRAGSENLMADAIPNTRLSGVPNKALAGDELAQKNTQPSSVNPIVPSNEFNYLKPFTALAKDSLPEHFTPVASTENPNKILSPDGALRIAGSPGSYLTTADQAAKNLQGVINEQRIQTLVREIDGIRAALQNAQGAASNNATIDGKIPIPRPGIALSPENITAYSGIKGIPALPENVNTPSIPGIRSGIPAKDGKILDTAEPGKLPTGTTLPPGAQASGSNVQTNNDPQGQNTGNKNVDPNAIDPNLIDSPSVEGERATAGSAGTGSSSEPGQTNQADLKTILAILALFACVIAGTASTTKGLPKPDVTQIAIRKKRASQRKIHPVQPGEKLGDIAQGNYGDPTLAKTIYYYNTQDQPGNAAVLDRIENENDIEAIKNIQPEPGTLLIILSDSEVARLEITQANAFKVRSKEEKYESLKKVPQKEQPGFDHLLPAWAREISSLSGVFNMLAAQFVSVATNTSIDTAFNNLLSLFVKTGYIAKRRRIIRLMSLTERQFRVIRPQKQAAAA